MHLFDYSIVGRLFCTDINIFKIENNKLRIETYYDSANGGSKIINIVKCGELYFPLIIDDFHFTMPDILNKYVKKKIICYDANTPYIEDWNIIESFYLKNVKQENITQNNQLYGKVVFIKIYVGVNFNILTNRI